MFEACDNRRKLELVPSCIYSDCITLVNMLKNVFEEPNWKLKDSYDNLKDLLSHCPTTEVDYIPRNLNFVADALANFVLQNPSLSLFHRGMQLPSWLMEIPLRWHCFFYFFF